MDAILRKIMTKTLDTKEKQKKTILLEVPSSIFLKERSHEPLVGFFGFGCPPNAVIDAFSIVPRDCQFSIPAKFR
jgi:hypothetical protein